MTDKTPNPFRGGYNSIRIEDKSPGDLGVILRSNSKRYTKEDY
jgi:hypothetical protein